LVESLTTLSRSSSVVSHASSVEILLSLNVTHQELNKLEDFRLVDEVEGQGLRVLLVVVLEVNSVSHFFLLELSHFLQLVVVHVELLSVESLLVKSLLGGQSLVGLSVANKGVKGFLLIGHHLKAFDLSVLAEEFHELLFGSVLREVLHVEVASSLGLLESELLLGLLEVTVRLLQSFLDIELLAFELFAVKFSDSVLSSFNSNILVGLVFVANESERRFLFFGWQLETFDGNALNGSVLGEEFLNLIFFP